MHARREIMFAAAPVVLQAGGFQFATVSPLFPTSRPSLIASNAASPFPSATAGEAAGGANCAAAATVSSPSALYTSRGIPHMQAASASAVAAHADTNTPFLLESAAKHWSPEKPKGSLQHTLAPPPAVVTAMTSSDAAAQYALAANAAHDALAAHYAQHPAIHYSAGAASTPHEQLQHGASAASPYGSNGSYAPYGNTNPYGTQQNQAIAHQHAPMQLPSQLHPQQNQHQPPQVVRLAVSIEHITLYITKHSNTLKMTDHVYK